MFSSKHQLTDIYIIRNFSRQYFLTNKNKFRNQLNSVLSRMYSLSLGNSTKWRLTESYNYPNVLSTRMHCLITVIVDCLKTKKYINGFILSLTSVLTYRRMPGAFSEAEIISEHTHCKNHFPNQYFCPVFQQKIYK